MSKCILHSWIYLTKISESVNPFTNQHVLRDERLCVDCNTKQFSIKDFSDTQKHKICQLAKVSIRTEWITYLPGDVLDKQADLMLKLNKNHHV